MKSKHFKSLCQLPLKVYLIHVFFLRIINQQTIKLKNKTYFAENKIYIM